MAAPLIAGGSAAARNVATGAAISSASGGGDDGGGGGSAAMLVAALICCAAVVLIIPILIVTAIEGNSSTSAGGCAAGSPAAANVAAAPGASGHYAAPLQLAPNTWYQVGATRYTGSYGAIPDPNQAFLPSHPDTFAELSTLNSNPANSGTFTFADADALNNLPYMTGLRVDANGHQEVLDKRDVGYGQGPGQFISNGQPYRIDVYGPSATPLNVSKSPVKIELAPTSGSSTTLGQAPAATSVACNGGSAPLTPGNTAKILSDGTAAAPANAPPQVQAVIAAGNEIISKPYVYGGGHGQSLDTVAASYDCSSSVSFALHGGGLLNSTPLTSAALESWGVAGAGQWVTVYANSGHTWVVVAGIALDTAEYGGSWVPAGSGPRWRSQPLANLADGLGYVTRHPPGL